MTRLTPLRAIREKCVDCMCGSFYEVKLCPSTDCPLYEFRFGKNPNRAGIGNKNPFDVKNANSTRDSAGLSSQTIKDTAETIGGEIRG